MSLMFPMLHHCQRIAGYSTSFSAFFRPVYFRISSIDLLEFESLLHT